MQPGAGLIGLNILNPVGGTDRMNGTAAIFSAISTASKIVDVKPYALMAINNEASTLANTDEQTYVQQTTITPTSGTNGQVLFSQIPGYVTYGQLIQVIPKVLPGGRVMVRFGIDDTKLKNLIQATKQGDIDKPLLGGLNFLNKSVIQSGGTLILSGFKRKVSKATDQGLFAKQTMGSEVGDTDYTETVIMMTPVLEGS
ncbi:hypothetical protein ACHMW6_00335 (plasmid) [Pseudoduganella sp. UC29_106]|uniref:hypothetical protein n=1 Tax=Pseudoduganella sp. UC29_106 TaxID=3374553 RepID=UPI00375776EF